MKKIITLALAAMMLFALCACASTPAKSADPLETIKAAAEKTNALKCTEMSIDMTTESLGMSMPTTGTIRLQKISDTEINFDMTMSMMGMEITTTFVDGMYYASTMGAKYKAPITDASLVLGQVTSASANANIDPAMIESVTAGAAKDGLTPYTCVMKPDYMNKMIANSASTGTAVADVKLTIKKSDLIIYVNKDGYIAKLDMDMDFLMGEDEASSSEVKMVGSYSYVNPGTEFVIAAPADAAEYIEVTAEQLNLISAGGTTTPVEGPSEVPAEEEEVAPVEGLDEPEETPAA